METVKHISNSESVSISLLIYLQQVWNKAVNPQKRLFRQLQGIQLPKEKS